MLIWIVLFFASSGFTHQVTILAPTCFLKCFSDIKFPLFYEERFLLNPLIHAPFKVCNCNIVPLVSSPLFFCYPSFLTLPWWSRIMSLVHSFLHLHNLWMFLDYIYSFIDLRTLPWEYSELPSGQKFKEKKSCLKGRVIEEGKREGIFHLLVHSKWPQCLGLSQNKAKSFTSVFQVDPF